MSLTFMFEQADFHAIAFMFEHADFDVGLSLLEGQIKHQGGLRVESKIYSSLHPMVSLVAGATHFKSNFLFSQ